MTVQSSFLIRCTLPGSVEAAAPKGYYVQHVQTGAEFRAATLDDATGWIATQNRLYLAIAVEQTPEEDLP